MKIFILHYHLLPGGVGRVIQSQIKALSPYYDVTILTGFAPDDSIWEDCEIKILPDLNYLQPGLKSDEYQEILLKIETFLKKTLSKEDILHVHNPNLGKNPLVTLALSKLAAEGYSIFMHIHDFAEDRPANQAFLKSIINKFSSNIEDVLYPKAERLAYGVLNSFDKKRITAIVGEEPCYFLPNPVNLPLIRNKESISQSRKTIVEKLNLTPELPIFIYPVRIIERKNIGEYLLFAKIWQKQANWLVTLPPENPREKINYHKWKDFAAAQKIPVVFEAGTQCAFPDLMFSADKIFTTSVREGFGMAFLEPWGFGKAVAGRNISYVTEDFKQEGIGLPDLYEKLSVMLNSSQVDFPQLSLKDQMKIISQTSLEQPEKTIPDFLELRHLLFSKTDEKLILNNKAIIQERYSIKGYGKRLQGIYEKLAGQP